MFRSSLFTAAAITLAISKVYAADADVSGAWTIEAKCERGGALPVCFFQQAGTKITGTCKGPNSLGTASGTVKGRSVEFVWDSTAYTRAEGPVRGEFFGTVNPDGTITGKAKNPFNGACTFAAAKR
jgi:hypothetical protein